MNGLIPTGKTALYTFIGTPIVQVQSPAYFNRYFVESEVDAVMVALDVAVANVEAYFEMMRGSDNLHGCIVTVPHKQATVAYMDELTERARVLAAVNVVRREGRWLIGDNVDGEGFVIGNRVRGFELVGKRIAIIGGGGVGRAIAYACAEQGVREIAFTDLRKQIYPQLREIVRVANWETEVSFDFVSLAGFDLVVNATPLGMNEDTRLPFGVETLSAETFVADVVTRPRMTAWLTAAQAKGCRIQFGADTSKGQMGYIGRFWGFDMPDPIEFK